MTELEALAQRVLDLETKNRELLARLAALDPETIARRALEILRTDPVIQTQDYRQRILGKGRTG